MGTVCVSLSLSLLISFSLPLLSSPSVSSLPFLLSKPSLMAGLKSQKFRFHFFEISVCYKYYSNQFSLKNRTFKSPSCCTMLNFPCETKTYSFFQIFISEVVIGKALPSAVCTSFTRPIPCSSTPEISAQVAVLAVDATFALELNIYLLPYLLPYSCSSESFPRVSLSGHWSKPKQLSPSRWKFTSPSNRLLGDVFSADLLGDPAELTVRVWRYENQHVSTTGFEVRSPLNRLFGVVFSTDLVGDPVDRSVRVWRFENHHVSITDFEIRSPLNRPFAVVFSADLVGDCADRSVRVWRYENHHVSITGFEIREPCLRLCFFCRLRETSVKPLLRRMHIPPPFLTVAPADGIVLGRWYDFEDWGLVFRDPPIVPHCQPHCQLKEMAHEIGFGLDRHLSLLKQPNQPYASFCLEIPTHYPPFLTRFLVNYFNMLCLLFTTCYLTTLTASQLALRLIKRVPYSFKWVVTNVLFLKITFPYVLNSLHNKSINTSASFFSPQILDIYHMS